jgi:hypothetical protein
MTSNMKICTLERKSVGVIIMNLSVFIVFTIKKVKQHIWEYILSFPLPKNTCKISQGSETLCIEVMRESLHLSCFLLET